MSTGKRTSILWFAVPLVLAAHGWLLAESLAAEKAKPSPDDKIVWHDCKDMMVEGKGWTDTLSFYDRLPGKAESKVPKKDWDLSHHSAGLCVRFTTDAPSLQVRWTLVNADLAMQHMPATGVSGLDLYAKNEAGQWRFACNCRPYGVTNTASCTLTPSKEYLLFLPLYNGVKSVEIGVPKGSSIAKPDAAALQRRKSVVLYGTSITQGGCASRPGMAFPAIVGRQLDVTIVNLGFSGSGRMEPEWADLLAELDPAVYVLDTLGNMSVEQVTERVGPFVKKLRKSRPNTPILLVEDASLKEISPTPLGRALRTAFEELKSQGVKDLYFLSNKGMLGDDREGTVDGVHPTDLGMLRHAEMFTQALRPLLETRVTSSALRGQEHYPPDRNSPGDRMIQAYLARETEKISEPSLSNAKSLADWEKLRIGYKEEYFYMLGLQPMPEKTPLAATVTGTLQGDGYAVEKLHYQSRPRLYVTGNLYRPPSVKPGERLPAVFYVCGHSNQGRAGNKTAYQSHGIWFARHGYICLMVDSLQLGEIAAIHHGTYRENRWWWHSRGYTPAGVECLNGMRGIDYLISRPDVDAERIGVTGISGGGAATFWIAAADERVKAAVPVSGMADLQSYVSDRVINGHCDCMFLNNTFQWPWTRIAALVAPRPLLFTNSDDDHIFPMDANDRVANRLERAYSLYGASDMFDAMVSIGGHAYRKDLRQAIFRFFNIHLKNDPRTVTDSEVDLPDGERNKQRYAIDPEKLRVFAQDSDIPRDELNTTIDRQFVPVAKVSPPQPGEFDAWKAGLIKELRRVSFRCFPERIPAAKLIAQVQPDDARLETEPGIEAGLLLSAAFKPAKPARVLLVVHDLDAKELVSPWLRQIQQPGDLVYLCAPRGVDRTRWTRKNPPNYVERAHVLLGRTVDTGRVWDVAATTRYLNAKYEGKLPVYVVGEGGAGVLAAYAALWEPEISGVVLNALPLGHMDADAPQFLNVLRVCDIPDVLGMLAPRPLTIYGAKGEALDKAATIYKATGEAAMFVLKTE
jgi:dienelactone hydrolase/lysophospholipase L1-like esterase